MEAEAAVAAKVVVSVLLGGFLVLFLYLCELLLLRPRGLRSKLGKQGIRGPPPSFLLGNLSAIKRLQSKGHSTATKTADPTKLHHDGDVASIDHEWHSKIFLYIEQWRNEYGQIFMYASAHLQQLCITDVEVVKEIGLCKSLNLGKASLTSKVVGPLLGEGLLSSNGLIWAHQRGIIAPELYLDKVKGMVDLIVDSTTSILRRWEDEIDSKGGIAEIKVDKYLRNLAADIISRACFNNRYDQVEEIFNKLRALQKVLTKGIMSLPGLRLLPTKDNRETWRLEKEAESMILKLVKQRIEASGEEDLFKMLLAGAGDSKGLSQKKFIVDNCKTIFFAGHETTAIAASWSLMLLAAHPDWQARARAEVLKICGDKPLDGDMLRSMKVLKMVIQEVLRLYPPAFFVTREAFETVTLKNIVIPKGVILQIPIPFLQHNPDIWGPDAHEFNPERFANGTFQACRSPQAYMPFGTGPRICVGQHLVMTELKVLLASVLSKFCFSLSPAYQHAPLFSLVTEPGHGVILHVRKV
ncbi:unnamed protein product [Prunus armeniaca]|uniref:Cytochrome P450 n=1 Tax=Prunus armeniaca TaxID=36596 RepID=A0A6J5WIM1_PRUAR|nr:unnamed protein product [Prunus armeniaca]